MKVSRILLIQPHEFYNPEIDYFRIGPSLACAFLSSVLKRNGYEVEYIDATAEAVENEIFVKNDLIRVGLDYDEIKKRIARYNPQVVGVTNIRTPQFPAVRDICRLVKEVNPGIVTLIGGAHATGDYEKILLDKNIDFIARGEGELSIVKLMEYLEGKIDLCNVPGIATNIDGETLKNQIERVPDLNALPDPDYTIFKKELYPNRHFHTAVIRGKFITDYVFSRGCDWACTFCASYMMTGNKCRFFDLDRIQDQLENLKELGYDEILLEDNDVFLKPELSVKVFEMLNKMGFYWSILNGLNLARLTDEMIDIIIEYGCSRVYFPVESLNIEIVENYKTRWRDFHKELGNVPRLCRKFTEAGIETEGGFMIGFPEETEEDIRKTIEFAKYLKDECGLSMALFFLVTPYPGTPFYWECKKKGYLIDENKYELFTFERAAIRTKHLTGQELEKIRMEGMREVNGEILYGEIRIKHHRPNVRDYYLSHPEYKWSKYFTNKYREDAKCRSSQLP